jgi:hypothetical protein
VPAPQQAAEAGDRGAAAGHIPAYAPDCGDQLSQAVCQRRSKVTASAVSRSGSPFGAWSGRHQPDRKSEDAARH